MAKRTTNDGVRLNKSAMVRELLEKNPDARPVEIARQLSERGIELTNTYASILKSKYMAQKRGGRKPRGRTAVARRSASTHANTRTGLEQIRDDYRRRLVDLRGDLQRQLNEVEKQLGYLG
jgi:hypothetical protein